MFQRSEKDLDRELRADLEMEAETEGPDAARRNFGSLAAAHEDCREAWGWAWAERLWQDVKFGWRSARKDAAYSLVAVATLALGIGANSAVFSVVRGVLLRPLDYAEPDRLVTVLHQNSNPVAPANMIDWRSRARSFSAMAGAGAWSATLSGERTERITGLQVSEGMFPMLGVAPLIGRTPSPEEHHTGRHRVAVLSYRLWRDRYQADRAILGRTMHLSGEAYTVIGVMPEHFRFAPFWITDAELWVPLTLDDKVAQRGGQFMRVFARLAPGVTNEQAQSEMNGIWANLKTAWPTENEGLTVHVTSLTRQTVGDVRRPLLVLLGAVGFVLLIACTNLANLALARGSGRRKEMAIRSALGAGRWRLVRQLLTESMLLAATGGILGLAIAELGVRLVRDSVHLLPRVQSVSLDSAIVLFTAAISILAGLLFGILPARAASRAEAAAALKQAARGNSDAGGASARDLLAAAEVAMAIVLLAGAGLLMRSFLAQRAIEPGFATHNVLSMEISLAGMHDYTGERRAAFYRQVMQQAAAVPGIRGVAIVNHLPIGGDVWYDAVHAEGHPLPKPGERLGAVYRVVSPGYFRTMDIALRDGRDFTDHDQTGAPLVTIVNETLARKLWPAGGAVGRRVTFDNPAEGAPRWWTIIGEAAPVKQRQLTAAPDPEFYVPFAQTEMYRNGTGPASSYMTLVARTEAGAAGLLPAVRSAVWSVNRNAAVSRARPMEEVVSRALWQPRFYASLLAAFAAFALMLAVIGVYGVISYGVNRRMQEIGIRMALGAGRGRVVAMVVGQAMKLSGAGIAIGIPAALWLSRSMEGLLHEVTPTDPVTFLAVAAGLAGASVLAAYLPARRAVRTDAARMLRSDG